MDEQGRSLPMLGVSSMAEVIRCALDYPMDKFQLYISLESSLSDALEMNKQMRPGVKDTGFATFNPEVVSLKVEAEAAAQAAVARAERSVARAGKKVEKIGAKISELEGLINAGHDEVYVGPSINRRSLDHEQVIYPYGAVVPERDVLIPRKLSKKRKLHSRGIDAGAQIAFWELNLDALKKKHAAQVSYRDNLAANVQDFRASLLHAPTLIGPGYSDYTFRF